MYKIDSLMPKPPSRLGILAYFKWADQFHVTDETDTDKGTARPPKSENYKPSKMNCLKRLMGIRSYASFVVSTKVVGVPETE